MPNPSQTLLRAKLDALVPPRMEELGVDLWLTFTREGAVDPIAADLGLGGVVARSASLMSRGGGAWRKVAVAASYDTTPIEEAGFHDEVIAFGKEGVGPHLRRLVTELRPRRLALNWSRDLPACDGLTLGGFRYLKEWLGADSKPPVRPSAGAAAAPGRPDRRRRARPLR